MRPLAVESAVKAIERIGCGVKRAAISLELVAGNLSIQCMASGPGESLAKLQVRLRSSSGRDGLGGLLVRHDRRLTARAPPQCKAKQVVVGCRATPAELPRPGCRDSVGRLSLHGFHWRRFKLGLAAT
jgi:hypothetical protein